VRSDLDPAAASELVAEAVLQVHEAAEAEESLDVLVAIEGAEHAREVVGGGDLRAEASAERLARGTAAEIVVAARPCRLGDELEPAGARRELDHRLLEVAEVERRSVGAACVEILERLVEPDEILLAHRGGDVDPLSQLARAADDAGEGADDDEADVPCLQSAKELARVEHRRGPVGHDLPLSASHGKLLLPIPILGSIQRRAAMESMMTVRQVAELLGVHENWVYDQAASGELPSYKIGGTRRFDPDELRGWIAEHREPENGRQPRRRVASKAIAAATDRRGTHHGERKSKSEQSTGADPRSCKNSKAAVEEPQPRLFEA
jgi:excisionase family DNA binding protein